MIDYDPFSPEVRRDPQPVYRRLRDEAPACFMPKYEAWALSRFQDIWDASSDAASFSAARGTAPAQLLTRDQPVEPMLNLMDPPDHTLLRAAVRPSFLPKRVRELEPVARRISAELIESALGRGELDVVSEFAGKLSVKIACLAIGLPIEDGEMLSGWVQRFFGHDPDTGGMTQDGLAALSELRAYCRDQVQARRRAGAPSQGTQDALGVIAGFDGGRFDADAAASHVNMLVIGGSETFPKVLANGVRRLAEHPEQRARLAADPALLPDAFTEILRYDMPTQFLGRTLLRDMELHGQTLRQGQAVIFLYASGNRDEREFADPDVFDVARRPDRILSFGAGIHQCLGAHVARMEGRVTLEELLARIPEYEVDLERAERLRTEFVQGFARLPIRFSPR